jgi:predicted RecB family nuclease
MPSQTRADATILAHHLYDFAECEHRVALDVSLEASRRTAPDEAMELLFEQGRRFEREIVEPLGYAAIELDDGGWDGAAGRTVELMRAGAAGIDQGVLIERGRLARPDLLERIPGASALGDHYYRPGDVKSARTVRADAVLQVGFAALLLETIQGRRPESGFLILGDGRKEDIDLEAIRFTIEDAVARAEAIARGEIDTEPYYSASCARCRWRGECLPRLQEGRDLSFVYGLTRSRHRVLRRHGVRTIDDLASADVGRLVAEGAPADGLERARAQAQALIEGRPMNLRPVKLPRGARREGYLRIEVDPLASGEPLLFAWGEGKSDGALDVVHASVTSSAPERAETWDRLVQSLEAPALRDEPIFTFGSGTARAFDAMAESSGLSAARAGEMAGRFVDLAAWVRRCGVFPVFHYRFDEIAAVASGKARPAPGVPEDTVFVIHATAPDARAKVEAIGREAIESLLAIRRWLSAVSSGATS